jgi:hypothetical protein
MVRKNSQWNVEKPGEWNTEKNWEKNPLLQKAKLSEVRDACKAAPTADLLPCVVGVEP